MNQSILTCLQVEYTFKCLESYLTLTSAEWKEKAYGMGLWLQLSLYIAGYWSNTVEKVLAPIIVGPASLFT